MILSNLSSAKIKQKVVDVSTFEEGAEIIIRRMTVADRVRQQHLMRPFFNEDGTSTLTMDDFLQINLACSMINEEGDYLVAEDEAVFNLVDTFDPDTFESLSAAYLELNPVKKETLDEKKT